MASFLLSSLTSSKTSSTCYFIMTGEFPQEDGTIWAMKRRKTHLKPATAQIGMDL
jgi:hypothetical protein